MLKSRYAVIDVLGIEKPPLYTWRYRDGISVILCGQPLVGSCFFSDLNITFLVAGFKRLLTFYESSVTYRINQHACRFGIIEAHYFPDGKSIASLVRYGIRGI